jgi:alkanesulfonate monooxygenase SsuD/methylene tetrahydromethanopterin reductase-like flavin-dependent oxidoreductase (luciferase family)
MMIGCVVGRDAGEVADRLAHIDSITGRHTEPPPIAGTLEEVVDRLRQYEAAGVERAMLQHLHHEDLEMVALLGDVADALRR